MSYKCNIYFSFNSFTVCIFYVQRWEQSDWLEVWTAALVKWRSTVMAAGVRCVITAGIKTWPPWCAPCCSVVPSRWNSPSFFLISPTTTGHCGSIYAIQTCWVCGSALSSSTNHICAAPQKHLASSVTASEQVFVHEIRFVQQQQYR